MARGEYHLIKLILSVQSSNFTKEKKAQRFEVPMGLAKKQIKSGWQLRLNL